jgi:hypothetical protein
MSASFPSVAMGSSSSQTVTLQNGGTGIVTISAATVTGAGFSTTGLALPMGIPPGQNATFNVVFSPRGAGPATGAIALVSDAPGSPLTITATGSSVANTLSLTANTTSLDFGSVVVGGSSSLNVTLINSGNADVTISSALVTGAEFSANGAGANTLLTPGQIAILTVLFAPTVAGNAAGSIAISSNAGALSITASGIGGQLSPHAVALNWDPSTSDVVGYYVYRVLTDGSFAKINSAPVVLTQYIDRSIQVGQSYTYVVTAVNADSVESDYSDPVIAVIP